MQKEIERETNYFLIRNPNKERINNLPLNSDSLTFSNRFNNDENTVSIIGGWISKKIIPECSLGGNNFLLIKCLSKVKITLDSNLAILDICLSLDFKGAFFTSNPSSFNNSVAFIGKFSSEISLGLLEENIFFFLNKFRSIIQDRQNSFFAELWEIILPDFINANSGSKQFQDLPDHNSCFFKDRFSFTNFIISNNVIINFSFHRINNNLDYLNFSNENFEVNPKSFSNSKFNDFDEINKLNGGVVK